MGGKKGFVTNYVNSWVKNPVENLLTGGNVALYKGTKEEIGDKLPEIFPGASKVKGFNMPQNLQEAEAQMIQRQAAIASGQAPSITEMQYNKALENQLRANQSAVASARGASNVGLLNRQAMMQGQQSSPAC